MGRLLALKTEVLSLRKEMGVEEKVSVPIVIGCPPPLHETIESNRYWFAKLAKVSEIKYDQSAVESHPELTWRFGTNFAVAVIYEKPIDVVAERDRLTKEIAKYEKGLAAAERQLSNEGFLAKAPAQVVEGLKRQESETRQLLDKARASLDSLPPE
jgi:valyl-tRNA synthetase